MGKRQHQVPESYLEAFAVHQNEGDTPAFWVYDKAGGEARPQTPINTTVESYYYSIKRPDGSRDDSIEGLLADVEGVAMPILRRWMADQDLRDSDRDEMAYYVSLMVTRGPQYRAAMEEADSAFLAAMMKITSRDEIQRAIENTGQDITVDEASRYFADPLSHFRLGFEQPKAMVTALDHAGFFASRIARMSWSLCIATGESFFVTGDAPACVFAHTSRKRVIFGGGIDLPTAELTMPVSPRIALLISHRHRQRRVVIREKLVKELNKRTAHMAHRYVVSPHRTKGIGELVRERAAQTWGRPQVDVAAVERSLRAADGKEEGRKGT